MAAVGLGLELGRRRVHATLTCPLPFDLSPPAPPLKLTPLALSSPPLVGSCKDVKLGPSAGAMASSAGGNEAEMQGGIVQHDAVAEAGTQGLLRRLDGIMCAADAYVNAQTSWESLGPQDRAFLKASAADVEATAHELFEGVVAARATVALGAVIPAGGRVSGGNVLPCWSSKPGAPVGTAVTGPKSGRAL